MPRRGRDQHRRRRAQSAEGAAEVAERVLAAVIEERFWIETDEFYRKPIRERHRAIEHRSDPPARGLALSPYSEE